MTPGLVRPPCRSRSSWVLRVLLTRLDDLAERAEEPSSRPRFLGFGRGPDEGDPGFVEGVLEAGPPIALVRDDGLADPGEAASGQHFEGDFALVGFKCRTPQCLVAEIPEGPRLRRQLYLIESFASRIGEHPFIAAQGEALTDVLGHPGRDIERGFRESA